MHRRRRMHRLAAVVLALGLGHDEASSAPIPLPCTFCLSIKNSVFLLKIPSFKNPCSSQHRLLLSQCVAFSCSSPSKDMPTALNCCVAIS